MRRPLWIAVLDLMGSCYWCQCLSEYPLPCGYLLPSLLILTFPEESWIMDTLPTFATLWYPAPQTTYLFPVLRCPSSAAAPVSWSLSSTAAPSALGPLLSSSPFFSLGINHALWGLTPIQSRELFKKRTEECKIRYRELKSVWGYSSFFPKQDPPCRGTHEHRPPWESSALYFYTCYNMKLSMRPWTTQIKNAFTIW